MKINLLISCVIWVLLITGCAQSTHVLSEPAGANVYINGRLKGQTPLIITTTISNHGEIPLSLSHPGYESMDTFLTKTGETDKLLRILGYIAVVPLDYDRKFEPQYKYILTPKQQKSYEVFKADNQDEPGKVNTLDTTKIEKLKKIQKAYNDKLITREEYMTLKKDILEGRD